MREEYIKKVVKKLSVSRNQEREAIRDLDKAFDSTKEHGETERQVVNRLGTPKGLAESMEKTIGFNRAQHRKRRRKLLVIYHSYGIAVFCLISAFVTKHSALPDNTIGQADPITQITVNNFWPSDTWSTLLTIGLISATVTAAPMIGLTRKKKWRLEEIK